MNEISANYDEMNESANVIKQSTEAYKQDVEELSEIVDSVKEFWEGTDNESYSEVVTNSKESLKNLGDVVNDYGVFLKRSAADFAETQRTNANRSVRM